MKQNCIYITYDINLKKYLWSKGIKTLIHGLNPNSKSIFWVYERTDELNKELDNWYNKNRI